MGSLDSSLEVSVEVCCVELEAETRAFLSDPASRVKTIGFWKILPFFFLPPFLETVRCLWSDELTVFPTTHRFYSDAVLGSLNRSLGIQQWKDLNHEQPVPLEKALAAFDMFISRDSEDDCQTVCRRRITSRRQSLTLTDLPISWQYSRRSARAISQSSRTDFASASYHDRQVSEKQ